MISQLIEDFLLTTSEQIEEVEYEKFTMGEISGDELERVHKLLSRWNKDGRELLDILKPNKT